MKYIFELGHPGMDAQYPEDEGVKSSMLSETIWAA